MIYNGLTTEELVAEIQLLEAENERLREEQIALATELGFGDGVHVWKFILFNAL